MLSDSLSFANEQALRQIIKERPRNGRARAQLALLLFQQEKTKTNKTNLEALKLAEEAIQVAPSKPFGHVAKSMIVQDHAERMIAIQQALLVLRTTNPHQTTRLELLIRLLLEPRRHANDMRRVLSKEEEEVYQEALRVIQHHADCTNDDNNKALIIGQAHYRLGTLFRKINSPRATNHFFSAVDLLPDSHPSHKLATFWLATLDASHGIITKCPQSYIVNLYSTFASRFDELLVTKLAYQTPTLLRQLLDKSCQRQDWSSRCITADLGCGTGLSGMAFRNVSQYMIGVDLSFEMIQQARTRQLYDDLIVGDVTAILTNTREYDLVVSCDTLVYFGDLSEMFAQVYESLSSNGIFSFSTELLSDNDENCLPYKLHECARFAHKQAYVLSLAQEYGFQILGKQTCAIRKNKGRDVMGLLVILSKVLR